MGLLAGVVENCLARGAAEGIFEMADVVVAAFERIALAAAALEKAEPVVALFADSAHSRGVVVELVDVDEAAAAEDALDPVTIAHEKFDAAVLVHLSVFNQSNESQGITI